MSDDASPGRQERQLQESPLGGVCVCVCARTCHRPHKAVLGVGMTRGIISADFLSV